MHDYSALFFKHLGSQHIQKEIKILYCMYKFDKILFKVHR